MLEFASKFFAVVLLPLLMGGAGWLIAQFFGKQMAKFYDARAQAIEALYFTENVGTIDLNADRERYNRASDELRRCAARLDAIGHDATRLTHWFLNWRGYNLDKAVKGLTGTSNSLAAKGYSRAFQRVLTEIGLRLPRSYSSDELATMRQNESLREGHM